MTSKFGLVPPWANNNGNVTSMKVLPDDDDAADIENKLALLFLGRLSKL